MRNETEAYEIKSQGDNVNAGCFEPKRKTRLQQLKEERDYQILQLGSIQAQITLIESDPAFEAKFEELVKLGY